VAQYLLSVTLPRSVLSTLFPYTTLFRSPARFARSYPFPLDEFQRTAIEALHGGESVLVAAPTGSGKTVVAEFALERALSQRRKRSEEHTSELQSLRHLVCRLLLEKKNHS